MEAEQMQNEDALRTASNDVFKFKQSSLFKNYFSDKHVVQLTDQLNDRLKNKFKDQLNVHFTDHLTDQFTDQLKSQLTDNSTSNSDENCNENSQMLIKNNEKSETIVKMDEFNGQEQIPLVQKDQLNDRKEEFDKIERKQPNHIESKQEVNEFRDKKFRCKELLNSSNHHHLDHSSKFSHHLYNNRTMDLVFNNIYVSIPATCSSKSFINQDKESIGKNWFKQLCIKYLGYNKKSSKLVQQKEHLNKEPTVITHAEHQTRRDILSNISGYSKPGQLLVVMGPSGCGKTTLLNTLSGRLKPRKGSITVNGEELSKQMKRRIGYVMQNDVFFTGLTLKQTLVYTALLRMPDSMSRNKKLKHVQRVIELLDLTSCEDTIIGDFMVRGLSGGEKKRASIACELLTNPSIMLLDEPTSGLDSYTAFNLMSKIKEYAIKEGKTVVATIHQPSSQMFYMFDKLLLLANGHLAYFGKSTHVVPFFESLGYSIAPHYNPADFMMEKVKQKDEIPKIVKAAKNLIKNYPLLSHSHRRGSNASNCKHLLKLTTSKMESQTDWSLIGIEDDLEEHHHSHCNHSNQNSNNNSQNTATDNQTDNHLLNQHSTATQHHCHHHFHKHHLNTLKEATESTTYDNKSLNEGERNHTDLCFNELCCKHRNCKLINPNNRSIHDDDSGRSSWTETDRSSTATFSSNNSCSSSTEDVYSEVNFEIDSKLTNRTNSNFHEQQQNDNSKWPTSFFTQVDVLTRRNFCETRHRMLSKLNWIQATGLGILTGLMWFQMSRLESTLNDIRGFLFFSTSYWMLFAWFGALISIPSERDVIQKERSSGAYRLSAFYIAKMIGELPLIIALPTFYFFICYPMFAINLNIYNFLFQWLFMVLCALVAQSIGLFIGLTTMSLEVSITVSAIYSTAVNLFGGYFSVTLPSWLSWMRYTSVLHYAFQNMQIIEFYFGGKIRCANNNSKFDYCLKQIAYLKEKMINDTQSIQLVNKSLVNNRSAELIIESTKSTIDELDDQTLFIPYNELISELNGTSSFWTNIVILIFFLFFFRLIGYLVLRFK